jgi:PTS system cellobiose-specific IIA component
MKEFNEWDQSLFQLVLHAGSARSSAKEAAGFADAGKWDEAEAALQKANDEQTQAHKINTSIITRASRGEEVELSVLLIHAMDLLMLAWSEIDFAEQHIQMSKRISALENAIRKN